MRDYECYICLNKSLAADIMSSSLSEARVTLTFLPASSRPHPPVPCPVTSAPALQLSPDKPLIHRVSTPESSACVSCYCDSLKIDATTKLPLLCVRVSQKCEQKSDRTTLLQRWIIKGSRQPETELFYRLLRSFSLHYIERFLLLKINSPEIFACLKQHAF